MNLLKKEIVYNKSKFLNNCIKLVGELDAYNITDFDTIIDDGGSMYKDYIKKNGKQTLIIKALQIINSLEYNWGIRVQEALDFDSTALMLVQEILVEELNGLSPLEGFYKTERLRSNLNSFKGKSKNESKLFMLL